MALSFATGGGRPNSSFRSPSGGELSLGSMVGLVALMAKLIEKMRRSLSMSYLSDDADGLHIADRTACGRIDCDLEQPLRMPLVVIDGREISWEQFGRMLMTFEGWQFKLQIFDRSEEP